MEEETSLNDTAEKGSEIYYLCEYERIYNDDFSWLSCQTNHLSRASKIHIVIGPVFLKHYIVHSINIPTLQTG